MLSHNSTPMTNDFMDNNGDDNKNENMHDLMKLSSWTEQPLGVSNSMSYEETLVSLSKYYVNGVFTPVVCLFGMVGNLLAVITWRRPTLRSSTGILLSAQAVFDFGLLLTTLLTLSLEEWSTDFVKDRIYAIFYSYIGFPVYYICVHCSVWMTLAVTIERYIMVCWATHARRLCGEKQAMVGVIIITITSLIGNIPHFLKYGVADLREQETGRIKDGERGLIVTEFGSGQSELIYGVYITCISLIAVPWFIVLFLNYKIVTTIILSNKRMLEKKSSESSANARKTETQVTKLLLGVTFSYLAAMGPFCLIQISVILHEDGLDPYAVNIGFNIAKAGYVINSSLNFVLYCLMGRRFRRELKLMLGIALSESDMSTVFSNSSVASSDSTTKSTSGLKS